MVRIKKQYKQPDGTLIEVEGTEAEIEAFERKQQKQKATIEETSRKKTILYGKDLEEIRKIVQEEIAKIPPKVEYRYVYEYRPAPYWVNPPNPWYQPAQIWLGANSSQGVLDTQSDTKVTIGDPPGSVSMGQLVSNSVSLDVTPEIWGTDYKIKTSCGGAIPTGQVWSGVIGKNDGSSNYLMSPRM